MAYSSFTQAQVNNIRRSDASRVFAPRERVPIELYIQSGDSAFVRLAPATGDCDMIMVYKAIVSHRGSGTNLYLKRASIPSGPFTADGGWEELQPGGAYLLECGGDARFNLCAFWVRDVAGATAHDVHVLAWL